MGKVKEFYSKEIERGMRRPPAEEQLDPIINYEGKEWFYDKTNQLLININNYEDRIPFGIIPIVDLVFIEAFIKEQVVI